jgi:glycerol-3-phosphate acyltransferase PlsX
MSTNRIALDVMGGDNAPLAVLKGALRACEAHTPDRLDPGRVILVGDEQRARAHLAELGGDPGFVYQHASQVIGMDEKPGQALRAKPDASIAVATGLVKAGAAGSVVSMGNTGAMVGAATLLLGTLPGVRRPGIAVTLELSGHPLTLIDMGANIVPKPQDLVQYAIMATAFLRVCLGVDTPRVGLLNIGEEASKGTDMLKEARALLAASDLQFVGNVEGGQIFEGVAEVIVTDGFTGNVVLKLMEGLAGFLLQLVMRELASHDVRWGPEALAKLKKSIDYAEYGGALLLGVTGVVVIGHGRSDETAVSNALRQAARALDAGILAEIERDLGRAQPERTDA